jgi:hypothetical protein
MCLNLAQPLDAVGYTIPFLRNMASTAAVLSCLAESCILQNKPWEWTCVPRLADWTRHWPAPIWGQVFSCAYISGCFANPHAQQNFTFMILQNVRFTVFVSQCNIAKKDNYLCFLFDSGHVAHETCTLPTNCCSSCFTSHLIHNVIACSKQIMPIHFWFMFNGIMYKWRNFYHLCLRLNPRHVKQLLYHCLLLLVKLKGWIDVCHESCFITGKEMSQYSVFIHQNCTW